VITWRANARRTRSVAPHTPGKGEMRATFQLYFALAASRLDRVP
jgi:hypothetical protein